MAITKKMKIKISDTESKDVEFGADAKNIDIQLEDNTTVNLQNYLDVNLKEILDNFQPSGPTGTLQWQDKF